jgi:hypothetical protein
MCADGTHGYSQATVHLNDAVDGLRRAGTQDELPRGFFARAALYRVVGNYDMARRDIDDALDIATRGQMRLHQADCHLEYARLHLRMGDKDNARQRLAVARTIIEATGYHRRDREVADLDAQL